MHAHRWPLPHDLDPFFRQDLMESHDYPSKDEVNRKIAVLVARLAGELGISTRKAASGEMHRFCRKMMQIGFDIRRSFPDLLYLPNGIGVLGREVLTEQLRRQGEEQRQRNVTIMEEVRYLNIACDAGTVLAFHNVQSWVTNPWKEDFPLLLDVYECGKGYTAEQYSEFFFLTTNALLERQIEICGVVIDNLRAQVKGFLQWVEKCPDTRVKAIVHVPCLAHSINLAVSNTENSNNFLQELMGRVRDLVPVLRTDESQGKLTTLCPLLVPTRWIYACDTLKFLVDKREDINTYLSGFTDDLGVGEDMVVLYQILLPIRLLVMKLESGSSALSTLIPLYRGFMEQMKNLWQGIKDAEPKADWSELFRNLLGRVMARISCCAHDAAVTSYLCTGVGRDEQRKMQMGHLTSLEIASQTRDGATNSGCDFQLNKVIYTMNQDRIDIGEADKADQARKEDRHEEGSEEDAMDEQIIVDGEDDGRVHEREVDDRDSEEVEPDLQDSSELSAMWFSRAIYKQAEKAILSRDLDEMLNLDVFPDVCNTGLRTLQAYGALLHPNIPPEEIQRLLDRYLFGENIMVGARQVRNDNPDRFWRELHKLDEWRTFSELVLHFITLPTTEADVERAFSKQKGIMGRHMTNLGTETLETRLRLQARTKK